LVEWRAKQADGVALKDVPGRFVNKRLEKLGIQQTNHSGKKQRNEAFRTPELSWAPPLIGGDAL
jgi:hypothetical protein